MSRDTNNYTMNIKVIVVKPINTRCEHICPEIKNAIPTKEKC